MTGPLGPKRHGRIVAGPYWGRDTAATHGQPRCPTVNQTYSSSAVTGRDGAAGPYMACKRSDDSFDRMAIALYGPHAGNADARID
jgi:hypothetical protein